MRRSYTGRPECMGALPRHILKGDHTMADLKIAQRNQQQIEQHKSEEPHSNHVEVGVVSLEILDCLRNDNGGSGQRGIVASSLIEVVTILQATR